MNRSAKRIWLCLLALFLLFTTACGKVRTEQLEPAGQAAAERAEPLGEKTELPEDGVITKEQLQTIAGKDGVFEFSGVDSDTGIYYVWSYEGTKIQNAAEQRLRVRFPAEGLEEIKEKANKATVGLGLQLEGMEMAAPATLKLILPEKWDADTVLLCKLMEGELAQMAQAEIGTESDGGVERTSLRFPVLETGDTYYLVGGVSRPAEGAPPPETEDGGQKETTGSEEPGSESARPESSAAPENSGQEGEETPAPEARHLCTISIDCITLEEHTALLKNQEKAAFVPADGWLLYGSQVEFTPGESVYDVLYRACQRAGYQMEANYTPLYGSYYVEGINNLYEFDGGELSGWMYSVNGWYPNYGCSSYIVSDGDSIRFRYTCDLGRDIGGSNGTG